MATDSTNLPFGETNVDAGSDMTGSDLDLMSVQLAQVEGAQPVELPTGNQVILVPVRPGQVIQLPTDSVSGLLAKIGPEGNLAFVVDGRTIILQGYLKANEQSPVKIVTNDGEPVDAADVIAATDPSLDIQTAAGPATGGQGDTDANGSGIFIPFAIGPGLGGIGAEGVLGATALQYKLIDDDRKEVTLDEGDEAGETSVTVTVTTSAEIRSEGGDCVFEDSFAPLALIATPGTPGDQVTQIVLDGIPAGWTVDTSSIVITGGGSLGSFSLVGDKLTINIDGAPVGAAITATLPIKGGEDSDVDGHGLVVSATAIDGAESANGSSTFDVHVDAVADGDDGDVDNLTVTIDVEDSSDSNASFETNEVGSVKVHATFDDHKDGSETHTLKVDAPAGFSFNLADVLLVLPVGVTLDGSSTTTSLLLIVDSKDGDGQPGLGSVDLDLPVTYDGGAIGTESGDFTATATAKEGNSVTTDGDGNDECTDANNTATATDTDTASLNSGPSITILGGAVVSDEGLALANPDSNPVPSDNTNSAVDSGTFTVSDPDAGDTLTVELQTSGLPALKFGGETVTWSVDPDGHTLHGQTSGTDAITVEISTLDGINYDYEVTLHKPLDHALTDDPATVATETSFEDEVSFNVTVKVTDAGGASSTALLTVEIEDDSPTAVLFPASGAGFIVVDESVGPSSIDPPSNDEAASADPLDIGYFKASSGSLFSAIASVGADQPGSQGFSLSVNAGDSLLIDTQSNQQVVFSVNPSGVVEGHAGLGGPLVLTISINPADGEVEVHQYRAVQHDDPSDPDEAASPATIAAGIIDVVLTVTDRDDDAATAKFDLGTRIQFQDDGPSITVIAAETAEAGIVLATQDAQTIGAASDAAVSGANFSGLFSIGSSSFGSDGAGAGPTLSYALGLLVTEGTASGLTIGGVPINLFQSGNTIIGSTAALESGVDGSNRVFEVSVDANGIVTLIQHQQIDHSVAEGAPTYNDDQKFLPNGLITLTATGTITDKDGDSANDSETIDLGGNLRFDDDGPTAVDDVDSVKEGDPTAAIGNVVTGANVTSFGADANSTDGNADAGGGDGLNLSSVIWTDAGEGGKDTNGQIVGKYGTLFVEADGDYQYVLDQTDPDVIKLGKDETISEDFLYTVADGDGDRDEGKLTLNIVGTNNGVDILDLTPKASGGDATVYEKALATRPGEPAGSSEAADFNGTDNDDPTELATGTFKVVAPDGVKDVVVHGVTIIDEGSLVAGPIVITTPLGNELTITGYNSATGEISYSYLLKDNEQHDPIQGPNGLFDEMTVTLTDKDLDSANGTLSIQIVDDLPVVLPTNSFTSLALDETLGGIGDHPDGSGTRFENDETLVALPPALTIPAYGTVIGAASGNVVDTFDVFPGADDLAIAVFGLQITNGGITGLTDTATGQPIILVQNGNVIEGRVGATTTVAFAVTIDPSTGNVSVAQYRAIVHPDTTSDDDIVHVNANVLSVTLTVTDKDGDVASASHEISSGISFDDDGPHSASISFVAGKDTLDDEGSPLIVASPGIDGASNPADDVAGTPNTVSFDVNVDAGSDGLGSIAYNLAQIQSQNAGLKAVDQTADGASITFSIEGGDIVGRISEGSMTGTLVLKVDATDADSFTVTQHSPLFHTGQGEVNDLDFKVVLDVTDKDGDSIQTTAVVKIDDDMPDAKPESGTAQAEPRMNTNLLLVLDDSGSMDGDTTLTNTNKLQALQAAVNELFEQYGNLGEVRVCFVRFDSSASTLTSGGNVWLTLEQAKDLLADLVANGQTNYDDALLEAIASYQESGKLAGGDVAGPIQNVGYFISDGEPNNNNSWASNPYNVPGWVAPASGPGVQGSDGVAGINTEEEYLQNFLNQEDIRMYSIGIGDGINATAAENLKHISYDGAGAGTNDDANLFIELEDLSQLSQTLAGTVVIPISGAISGFGADGGYVSQVTISGVTASFNGSTITLVDPAGGASGTVNPPGSPIAGGNNVVRILLTTGSALFINMATGAWQYIPAAGDGGAHNFGFTLTDFDGDTSSSTLTVSTDVGGFKPIVRDDTIITNIAGAFSIIDKALMWNDEEKDAGQTIAISANQADITNVAAGTVTRDVSDIDVSGDATEFTYKGISADGSDTGNVSITHVAGNTLIGNGLDNVLIAGDGDDLLLGYQGNDVLLGGGGNDVLRPGTGTDYVDGDAGTKDILDFSDVSGDWSFTLGAGGSGTANVSGADTYKGIEGIFGGAGNNTITGNTDGNFISGGDGNDALNGDDGNDALLGGDGADTLNGGAGADQLVGGASADVLNGGDGADTLDGGESSDTYNGGKGADTISVSAANDTIVYNAVANLDAADIVNGFDNNQSGGHDTVDLDALFDALNVLNGDRAGRISVVDVGADVQLRVDLDNNGSDETTILTFVGIGDISGFGIGNSGNDDIKFGTL